MKQTGVKVRLGDIEYNREAIIARVTKAIHKSGLISEARDFEKAAANYPLYEDLMYLVDHTVDLYPGKRYVLGEW